MDYSKNDILKNLDYSNYNEYNDYNVNVHPILAEYNRTNSTNTQGVPPLIPADLETYSWQKSNVPVNKYGLPETLTNLRGYGLYNPAPLYPQTTDRGHAWSKVDPKPQIFDKSYVPITGDVNITPFGATEVQGTWDINTNYNLEYISDNNNGNNGNNNNKNVTENFDTMQDDNYKYYDEYQRWALNATRLSDPYLLPYLFSKINVKFIQDKVVEYVKKYRDITIETKQDTDNLLNLMLTNYSLFKQSNKILGKNNCATNPDEDDVFKFESILGHLNKNIIEQYLKSVFSGLNMHEYYMKDISTLPMPLTRPTNASNKGSKVLAHIGSFQRDNIAFTSAVDSFNIRSANPGVLKNTKFGN